MGRKLCPSSVRLYSTRGGTSGNTRRTIRPCFSMSRRLLVSTFWEMSPTERCNSRKRMGWERRSRMIRNHHLPPMSWAVVSTGQAGRSERCGRASLRYSVKLSFAAAHIAIYLLESSSSLTTTTFPKPSESSRNAWASAICESEKTRAGATSTCSRSTNEKSSSRCNWSTLSE